MEDPTAHLSTDLGKAIWYLKNSIMLLDLRHDIQTHCMRAAIDKRIQENIEAKERGESPDVGPIPEIIKLQEYEKEICDEIRGALFVGHERSIELPVCKRLLSSIECKGQVPATPDFRTFIFDALVELETLLVAVEGYREPACTIQPSDSRLDLEPNQGLKDALKVFTGLPVEKQNDYKLQLFLEQYPNANAKAMMLHLGIGHEKLIDLPTYQKRRAKESRSSVNLRDSDGVFSNNN